MLETTRGIVLRYNQFGDDKAFVDIFTLSHGSLSFLVRDRRQRKGSLRATLLRPLHIVEMTIDYRPTQATHRIQELHLACCYTSLPYDPVKEVVALFLSEFLLNAIRKEVHNPQLFHYTAYSLQWFDATDRGLANFHIAFLLGLARHLGFWPNMSEGETMPYFDLQDGRPTDSMPMHDHFLTGEEAAALPTLLRMNLHNMHQFRLTREQRNRILDVLTLYFSLHVPEFRELRSLDVLRQVLA